MMMRLLMGLAMAVAAGAAAGQVMECVDAQGRKEYAQVCPPGTVKENRLMKSSPAAKPAAAPAPAKSLAEREAGFRKRAMEREEAEAKAEREKADAKISERNCLDARAQFKALQDGQRLVRTDPNTGERRYLTDAERPAEVAVARQAVESWCKK